MTSASEDEEPNSVPDLPKSQNSGTFTTQSVPSPSVLERLDYATPLTIARPADILINFNGSIPLSFGANRNARPSLPIHGPTTRTDVKCLVPTAPFRKTKKNTAGREACAIQMSHQHPNFLDHFALVSENDFITAIISMSAKQTLVEALSDKALPSKEQSLRWAEQLCQGVYFLHSQYIAHGCLDPYHVYLDEASQVKLFLAPFPLFTPDRNSPCTATELRQSLATSPTLESDIYSLGCLIFFMLEGRTPKKDMFGVVIREDLSVDMVQTLRLCWNNPADRPSAEHLLESVKMNVS